ncbi:MAG: hypothetical protein ACKV2V_09715 [Blastocatellia bacterium]
MRDLAQLDNDRLAQFLTLWSFAHYGANPMASRHVDQSMVIRLGEQHGVNNLLIDAQACAEFSPKKYRAAHQGYLEAVTAGKAAAKPVVYETTTASIKSEGAAGPRDEDG